MRVARPVFAAGSFLEKIHKKMLPDQNLLLDVIAREGRAFYSRITVFFERSEKGEVW